jgi:YVTN family beta-propeller protein
MEFRILGPLVVIRDGRVLRLGSGRQLALVALLLINANEAVSVDRLIDELWGESPPPTAAKIVRNSVSLLRRELGDRLVTQPPGYLLRVEQDELDSERLERALESGDLERLTEALGLWRGPPLSQLAYEQFAQQEIARLEELRLAAVEASVEAQLGLGRHADVIGELEVLVRQHPLRERLSGQLILALYRSGQQVKALEAYRHVRRSLDEQLGIQPGPALRDLERRILNQDESLAAPPAAHPPRPSGRPRGLALVVAGALVLLVAAVAAAFLATRDSAHGLSVIQPNHVGMIDPKTNAFVAEIPVGIRPGPIAVGAGSVWVGNLEDRNMTRVDPRRRMAVAAISLGSRTPTGLAVGAGAVWVAHGLSGELSRVDAEFGQVTKTVTVTARPYGASTGSVAVGAGHVWAAFGDSTLARVQPTTARVSGSVLAGSNPAAVVVGAGAVWVANSGGATVQRFDPNTFEEGPIRPTISVAGQPSGMAYGDRALWIACRADDVVTRVDPSTNSAITIHVGDAPGAVAVSPGAVWVANSDDGTISRIDTHTNEVVRTIEVGGTPSGITYADGLVWVSVQAP